MEWTDENSCAAAEPLSRKPHLPSSVEQFRGLKISPGPVDRCSPSATTPPRVPFVTSKSINITEANADSEELEQLAVQGQLMLDALPIWAGQAQAARLQTEEAVVALSTR